MWGVVCCAGLCCCCCGVWAKSDCNCKSARQKLKDQQTDKNGGRQVLLQLLLLVLLVLQFVAFCCCCCCCCHSGCCGPSVRCCSCQCLPPSQSRVEQIKHKMQLWASAKLFNITLSGIIIIHCAAALWGNHTHKHTYRDIHCHYGVTHAEKLTQCYVAATMKNHLQFGLSICENYKKYAYVEYFGEIICNSNCRPRYVRRCGNAAEWHPHLAWVPQSPPLLVLLVLVLQKAPSTPNL